MSRRGFIGPTNIEEIKYFVNALRERRDRLLNKELPTYKQKNVDITYNKLKEIKKEATNKLNLPTTSQEEKYDLEELIKDVDELAASIEGHVSNEYIELGQGPMESGIGGKKRRISRSRRQRRTNKRKSNKRRKRYTGKRR